MYNIKTSEKSPTIWELITLLNNIKRNFLRKVIGHIKIFLTEWMKKYTMSKCVRCS